MAGVEMTYVSSGEEPIFYEENDNTMNSCDKIKFREPQAAMPEKFTSCMNRKNPL